MAPPLAEATSDPTSHSSISTPSTSILDLEKSLQPQSQPQSQSQSPQEHCTLPKWRKYLVLATVSWLALVTTYMSTSLLPATPEIGKEFQTTVTILNITNAAFLVAMGLSSFIWSPLVEVLGRRKAYNTAILVIFACSIGTALAPSLGVFVAMRTLSGFEGTFLLVAGQTILADIFEPTIRGRAVGFFMAGTVSGPAIGPLIGGVIVTYTSWRAIYWVQVAMVGLGLVASFTLVPNIRKSSDHATTPDEKVSSPSTTELISNFNPMRLLRPLVYPNVVLADISCGLLATFQYGILTSVREIINPRFNLTTPLISGLFYIAPGAGFLLGSIIGGQFSDRVVRNYIVKRKGVRIPQDRLNSGLVTMLLIVPSASLIYGWTLRKGVGGMAVPVIMAFLGGAGVMGAFNGLNTYAAEVLPHKRSEVIGGKYIIQYMFSAGSSAVIVPAIHAIGVGWAFSILAMLVGLAGFIVLVIAKRGLDMQHWVERKLGREEE